MTWNIERNPFFTLFTKYGQQIQILSIMINPQQRILTIHAGNMADYHRLFEYGAPGTEMHDLPVPITVSYTGSKLNCIRLLRAVDQVDESFAEIKSEVCNIVGILPTQLEFNIPPLPHIAYFPGLFGIEDTSKEGICGICLERGTVVTTICKHDFHSDCLYRWQRENTHEGMPIANSAQCPLCRKVLKI